MLKVKSVSSSMDRKSDGLRILATRIRGRGLRASRYDVWMACLGPSERLLARQLPWPQFSREYKKELFLDGKVDSRNRNIKNHGQKFTLRLIKRLARKGHVTLMCHCDEDQRHCHRFLLRDLVSKA